jgi:hypothetical protein
MNYWDRFFLAFGVSDFLLASILVVLVLLLKDARTKTKMLKEKDASKRHREISKKD